MADEAIVRVYGTNLPSRSANVKCRLNRATLWFSGKQKNPAEARAIGRWKIDGEEKSNGTGDWIRTSDPQIHNLVL